MPDAWWCMLMMSLSAMLRCHADRAWQAPGVGEGEGWRQGYG